MAAKKRSSAFDSAMIEAQTHAIPVDETDELESESIVAVNTLKTIETIETTKSKGGRPRGITKMKKTFYLTSAGMESLNDAVLELGNRARLRIKDDSEVADIALALLSETVKEPGGVEKILAVREKLARSNV